MSVTSADTAHLQTIDRPLRIVPNGMFTLRGPYGHRTFSVERQAEDAEWAPGERVLYLLTAGDPDDMRAWTSLAFIKDPKGVIDTPPGWQAMQPAFGKTSVATVFKKHRGTVFEILVKMLMEMVVAGSREFTCAKDDKVHGYEILCAKHCLRCDRRLTTPSSIAIGYGPECAEKLGLA